MIKILPYLLMFILPYGIVNAQSATEACFSKIVEKRHSGKSFDPEQGVCQNLMVKLAEAAHAAPSSYNDQPWRFIFCHRDENSKAYTKALACLVESNQEWAKNAPLLIIVVADSKLTRNDKPNGYGEYDTGAAAMSLLYKATSLGLMAHEMGGFDKAEIVSQFGIPERYVPMAVIAVGYEPADAKILPRTRRPLNDQFFLGKWGKGIQK